MSSPNIVSKYVAMTEHALARGDAPAASRHLSDAAEASLELATSVGPGPDRDRLLAGAEEFVSTLEELIGHRPGSGRGRVRERPSIRLKDVAGMENVKTKLRELTMPMKHPEVANLYGIRAGGGILLYGPPGNGKTTLARAVAGETGADFFCLSGADIRSKWHGESEHNLKEVFDEAKSCRFSVVFFDDVDGVLPQRGPDQGADNRLVTQFLQEVGGFFETKNTMILLGATNNPWDVDPAVLRTCRFDHKIFVGLPDQAAREAMLRAQVGPAPLDPNVELGALAARLAGYTGSDITAIVSAAKLAAATRFTEGRAPDITLADIEEALLTVPPSANSQLMARYEEYARTTRS
jgi:SpoVK/Ycf46/Vps4 family AAA+-type ATPase